MTLEWLGRACAAMVILWTLLPLLRHDAWWVRAFEFPRVQVTIVSTLVLAGYAISSGWQAPLDVAVLTALGACIVFQLSKIARYTAAFPVQVRSTPAHAVDADGTLGVLVANVLTPNRNSAGLLRLVEHYDPDLVLTVETDAWWEAQLATLETRYPHTVKRALDNLYGMHLYSRLPLSDVRVECLVEEDVPSVHARVRLRSGHQVALHCLHPAPPSPTENPTSAERDAELLIVAKAVARRGGSAVVMGDLNDVAWSATTRLFQNLSGLLDPRIGRGMFNTFHARYPIVRWPLDHVFCSADFTVRRLARGAAFGSDHFPIHVVLQHTPRARAVHERPRADADEHDWAHEKIQKVDADPRALHMRPQGPA